MLEQYWHKTIFSNCYIYEMVFNTYKPGEPASIRACEGIDVSNDSHILVYWAKESRPAPDLKYAHTPTIAEIQPIQIFPKDVTELKQLQDRLNKEQDTLIPLIDVLSNRCIAECIALNDRQAEGTWVFCDISTCCYVVLSAEGANPIGIEGSGTSKGNFDLINANIRRIKDEIHSQESILCHNKNHPEFQRLIKRAYELEGGIPERQYEGLSFAWLLFNTERSETALRYLRSSGEIHESEEFDARNVRDARFLLLKGYTENFLDQASNQNDQGQIWATLHFTMFLLELAMYDEPNAEIFNDFMGLYPVIGSEDQKGETLCTISPIQYSPQFTFAFLCIPIDMRYRFSAIFCQLLHEFFHYIPTNTRPTRNELFLRMLGCALLGENREPDAEESLTDFLMYHYKRLGHDTLLFQDSMSFISIMRVVLNRVDILEYLKKQGFCVPDSQNFPSKPEQIELLWSYTFFLREVRSDISMIELLNVNKSDSKPLFGLREYIWLMANEPRWATLSADEISIDSILRFGYMTHWIQERVEGNYNLEPKGVINELSDKCSDPLLKRKYENLIQYLNEYDKEWKKIRFFKEDIRDFTERWCQDKHLNRIKKNPFWKGVLNLFEISDFDRSSYDLSKVQKDFIIKLLLLNLPHYKEYYIEKEPTE